MQQAAREAGTFSACWDRDRGCLGRRNILCADILGGQLWRDRRSISGLSPQAYIRRKREKAGRGIKYSHKTISNGA